MHRRTGGWARPDRAVQHHHPAESNDLATEYPENVNRMRNMMSEAHEPSKRFPMPPIDNTAPPPKGD